MGSFWFLCTLTTTAILASKGVERLLCVVAKRVFKKDKQISREPTKCAKPRNDTTLLRDPFDPSPRVGYLSWDDYFMGLAFLTAQRSKDPSKQVGACIVSKENIILGIGYNGFPRGCSDRALPWAKSAVDKNPLSTKYPYVVHAEANAILNKNSACIGGARIYVTLFPCNECAKLLIQAGIVEVVYHEDKPGNQKSTTVAKEQMYMASKRLLEMAGVKYRQHRPDKELCLAM